MLNKKKILLGIVSLCLCFSMSGCSILLKDQPINQKTITDESMLASDMLYVWHSNNGKSLETVIEERQNANFGQKEKGTEEIDSTESTEALVDDYVFLKSYYNENAATFMATDSFSDGFVNENRPQIQWIKKENEEDIPTLYANDALVYYSEDTLPKSFQFARFLDNGYTFGIAGLKIQDNGKCVYELNSNLLMQDDREGLLSNLNNSGDNYVTIKSVGNKTIDEYNLDKYGAIKGLKSNKAYDVIVYKGTVKYNTNYSADKKMLVYSGELFDVDNYDLLNNNTAVIHIPDYCTSGYYFVNHIGFIRYISPEDEGIKQSKIDFNKPLSISEEETETKTETETETEDTEEQNAQFKISNNPTETQTESGEAMVYSFSVEKNAKNLTFIIEYKEAETGEFLPSPYAIVVDSAGNEMQRVESSGTEISGQLADLSSGTYMIEVFDLYGRESTCTIVSK